MAFFENLWLRIVSRCLFERSRLLHVTDSQKGASLVEYALLLALIALVCFGAVTLLGQKTGVPLSQIGSGIGS